jgi:hypothetical protein
MPRTGSTIHVRAEKCHINMAGTHACGGAGRRCSGTIPTAPTHIVRMSVKATRPKLPAGTVKVTLNILCRQAAGACVSGLLRQAG